jgi:hypothetical protein
MSPKDISSVKGIGSQILDERSIRGYIWAQSLLCKENAAHQRLITGSCNKLLSKQNVFVFTSGLSYFITGFINIRNYELTL